MSGPDAEPGLRAALDDLRPHLLDPAGLVRGIASGALRGEEPRWRRAELRYVDLKAGRHLQVTAYDDTQAHTANHPVDPETGQAAGQAAGEAVDALLAEPFGSWHVETTTRTRTVRVTRKGRVLASDGARAEPAVVDRGHDRTRQRLLEESDPVFRALGLSDEQGRIKPTRRAKYRQVEEFLRLLDASVTDALDRGHLRRPTAEAPLRVADLGCGNAYLTFAAHRFLTAVRGLPVVLTGVDTREQSREHNDDVVAELAGAGPIDMQGDMEFVVGSIAAVELDPAPEVVLALHACDTASDEALARAVGWQAPVVLVAPCCHHDIAAQLRRAPTPPPYAVLTRDGILRERLADTLTDGLRASLMRQAGYRVDVVQFVGPEHTPRNTMLRAVRVGGPGRDPAATSEYDELVTAWVVRPRLGELLGELPEAPCGGAG